jgi:hypothetical protein
MLNACERIRPVAAPPQLCASAAARLGGTV